MTQLILIGTIFILNVRSYFLYYSDKKRAVKKQSRISEKKLLLTSLFFGGIGAWIGMMQFRHKTKQMKFKIFVPVSVLITVVALYFIIQPFH